MFLTVIRLREARHKVLCPGRGYGHYVLAASALASTDRNGKPMYGHA